jgi:hypothetical protein
MVVIFMMLEIVMCIMCGLTQSVQLLSIGYAPTDMDISLLHERQQRIEMIEEYSILEQLDHDIAQLLPEYTDDRSQYFLYAIDDIIEYQKLFG